MDDENLEIAFVQVWQKFCDKIVPLHQGCDWNRCRVEFWSDNGKIVMYPDTLQNKMDVAVGACEVTSDWFRQYVRNRLFSDCPIEGAEKEIEELEIRIAKGISRAAQEARIARILAKGRIEIVFCMPGDDEAFETAMVT